MIKIMIYHEQGVASLFDKGDINKDTEDKLVEQISGIFTSNKIAVIRTTEDIGIFRPSKISGIYITKVEEETNKSEYIEQNNKDKQDKITEDIITDIEE